VGHTKTAFFGVEPADVFVNDLGHVARRLYSRWTFNELGQSLAPLSRA
jgi:hypothetical protein